MSYLEQLKPTDQYNQTLQSHVHPIDWKNPIPSGRYNLVVIGGGTAGLVTAAGAVGLGAKVALVERGLMGGDCLNVGCVPSKALISAARQAAAVRDSSKFGIGSGPPDVDFPAVMQRMRRLRAAISPHDSAARFTELGVDVYFGQATFAGNNTVEVGDRTLAFKKAVIATGARAAELPIPGLQDAGYLTNETLFSLTALPRRLIVIGGGPIGCEMAQSFARFGSKVTLIDMAPRVLSREDEDASFAVQRSFDEDGIELVLGAKVRRVETDGADKVVVVERQNGEHRVTGDQIFVGIGRTPNLDGLGLERVGVEADAQRGVRVDDRLRTTNHRIFAAGDVCSQFKFTHAADFLARIVIQNALFMGRAKASQLIIPWCTYTSPEVAHVGIYPNEAAQQGIALSVFEQPLSGVDRAILDGKEDGFVRVYCRKGSDQILGATIVAPSAGDLIGNIVLAMKHKIGLKKIASVIQPYPTQADAIRKLGDQFNRTRLTPAIKSIFTSWLRWTR